MNSYGVCPLGGFEPPTEVVSGNEVVNLISELGAIVAMITFDHRYLDRPVHAFDLSVGREIHLLRQPVLNVEIGACSLSPEWPNDLS